MNINYMLVASGHVTLPKINNAIFSETEEHARNEAQKVVAALYKGGYFSFCLYNVENAISKHVCVFRVEEREPLVLTR